MKVLFINNEGAGFADYIDVEEGITVERLFRERMPYGKPEDYLIRVNRQPVAAHQVIHEGDRLSCTAVKIQGAAA